MEDTTEIKVYSNLEKIALYVDGRLFAQQEGQHVFRFQVPIDGVHQIRAVGGGCEDSMEIAKADAPNPSYFMSHDKVRNWFDAPQANGEDREGYLSINSTMAQIQATEQGAALLADILGRMTIVARQPLKKLLQQCGMELEEEKLEELNRALNQIRKAEVQKESERG